MRLPSVPDHLVKVLARKPGQRTEQQKTELAKYYRSVAPESAPVREKIAALRKQGPVTRIPTGNGRTTWVVTGWEAARAALADARLSKDTTRFFADRR